MGEKRDMLQQGGKHFSVGFKSLQDGTNLKRRDGLSFAKLVQRDESEEGRNCAIANFLRVNQRAGIDHHFYFHGLVADERETARHSHHTALTEEDGKRKIDFFFVFAYSNRLQVE